MKDDNIDILQNNCRIRFERDNKYAKEEETFENKIEVDIKCEKLKD